ncbi:hypothetical protein HK096_002098, partial [Nowakowskiella sp. JEL0078]
MRLRNVLMGLIYRKSIERLQKDSSADGEITKSASVGKINSLFSNDAFLVAHWGALVYLPVLAIFQCLVNIFFLVFILGWPALIGVFVMVLMIAIGAPLAKRLSKTFVELAYARDSRIDSVGKLLQSIRSVKLLGWESFFERMISSKRETELIALQKKLCWETASRIYWYICPVVVSFCTLFIFTKISGGELTASLAFTSLALLNLLRIPLQGVPDNMIAVINLWIAYSRIQMFLNEENHEKYAGVETEINDDDLFGKINIENATFSWEKVIQENEIEPKNFEIHSVTLKILPESFTVIFGPTGSGKTSLLLAILGEMPCISGFFKTSKSTISYVSQSPWLFNATIRENILFGNTFEEGRYHEVLLACALYQDLSNIKGGDLAEIGEWGVNLSGGQKQRISLARAAYSISDIVLLDSPLSAVDPLTSKHLMQNLIAGPKAFLRKRTRIMVTHNIAGCLSISNLLIVMETGKISALGTVNEVVEKIKSKPIIEGIMSEILSVSSKENVDTFIELNSEKAYESFDTFEVNLVTDELPIIGVVQLQTYWLYISFAGGITFALALLFSFTSKHGMTILQDYWIKIWSESYSILNMGLIRITENSPWIGSMLLNGSPNSDSNINYYISVYALIGLSSILAMLFSLFILLVSNIRAAREFHHHLIKRILGASTAFFDKTPTGRILNRFTRDISAIDGDVNNITGRFFEIIVFFVSVVATVCYIMPPFLSVIIVLGVVYFKVGQTYLAPARALNRLESISKSPIFSHFNETLNGVINIRAANKESWFISENEKLVSDFNRVSFALAAANLWMSIRIQLLGTLALFLAGISVLYLDLDAGLAGLCLNFTVVLSDAIMSVVYLRSDVEMSFNAVERVNEYFQIPQEEKENSAVAPENWPSSGEIRISNLSIRYSPELPLVLNGINLIIRAGEKVALVGRTGSGKTTLAMSVFRTVEPESGSEILIDGVNILNLNLQSLRNRIACIPQDPILFEGKTLRENLDPFFACDDAKLWQILLSTFVIKSPSQLSLDMVITASTFSKGERQLVCLARALVCKTMVVVVDEMTASVDNETDAYIQETIKEELSKVTVLAIAHRIKSIIDFDKIVVLENGNIVEIGLPYDLM